LVGAFPRTLVPGLEQLRGCWVNGWLDTGSYIAGPLVGLPLVAQLMPYHTPAFIWFLVHLPSYSWTRLDIVSNTLVGCTLVVVAAPVAVPWLPSWFLALLVCQAPRWLGASRSRLTQFRFSYCGYLLVTWFWTL